jgi:hypothetical protein
LTWKVKVTKYNRSLYQLSPSMRHTEETGSGLLATPNTMEGLEPKKLERIVAHNQKARPGRSYLSMNLREEIAYGQRKLDGTMLPTPKAQNARGGGQIHGTGGQDLTVAIGVGTKTGLKLQPGFALWMMGYPTDWCDLTEDEMPKRPDRKGGGTQH